MLRGTDLESQTPRKCHPHWNSGIFQLACHVYLHLFMDMTCIEPTINIFYLYMYIRIMYAQYAKSMKRSGTDGVERMRRRQKAMAEEAWQIAHETGRKRSSVSI